MTAPTLRLDSMQFFGRLASTYHAMFGVTVEQLRGLRVLDCPGGPSSFVAEACAAGAHAVAVDPLYAHTAEELRARCEADIAGTIQAMIAHGNAYAELDLAHYADEKREDEAVIKHRPQNFTCVDFRPRGTGRGTGNHDALCVNHFTHHSPGAICGSH